MVVQCHSHFPKVHVSIFSDLIDTCIEIFMDDFSVFGPNFDACLANLDFSLKGVKTSTWS